MPTISRILVPVDLSVCSRAAIDFAAVIGRQFGASIDILNVWEPPRGVGPEFLIREPGEKGHPLLEDARVQAERELSDFLSGVEGHEKFGNRLEHGNAYKVIVKVASEGYDLVVMGTHGRTGLPHLLLGSVTEKVVRTATVPVLTVHAAETHPVQVAA